MFLDCFPLVTMENLALWPRTMTAGTLARITMKQTRARIQDNLGLFIVEIHKFWIGCPSKDFGIGWGSHGGSGGRTC